MTKISDQSDQDFKAWDREYTEALADVKIRRTAANAAGDDQERANLKAQRKEIKKQRKKLVKIRAAYNAARIGPSDAEKALSKRTAEARLSFERIKAAGETLTELGNVAGKLAELVTIFTGR